MMACCSIALSFTNLVVFCTLAFLAKKAFKLFQKWKLEKKLEKYDKSPKDKVILHTIRRCKTMPSISPFALKLETYLRMANIPYELETKDYLGPKDKLPWITYNGQHIGDTHLIIQHLNKKLEINLDKKFTSEQLAVARACRVMLEEHMFWGGARYRFIENSSNISQLIKLPLVFKLLIPFARCRLQNKLEAHGIGLHTPTEIYQMTEDDLRTVSVILGQKKFLCGDEPCEDDCAIFGIIAQAVWGTPGSSYERLSHGELRNLKDYCERMKDRFWKDWNDCIDQS